MSKSKLIQHIRQMNPTARRDWLDRFDEQSLRRYLDHLQKTVEPRGGGSVWRRPRHAAAAATTRRRWI
ncbi:MAG: hypothetical protein ACYTG1_00065 [Planctomycetota bacterium]|jgi:hypothetical protein